MDKHQRQFVFDHLRINLNLGDPVDAQPITNHPVVVLWKDADENVCNAIFQNFLRYTNFKLEPVVRDLVGKGLRQMINVVLALQDLVNEKRESKNENSENKYVKKYENLLIFLQDIHKNLHNIGNVKEDDRANAQKILARQIITAGRLVNKNKQKGNNFITDETLKEFAKFLTATDKLSIEIRQAISEERNLDFYLALLIRAHEGEAADRADSIVRLPEIEDSGIFQGKRDGGIEHIRYVLHPDIERFATIAFSLEYAELGNEKSEFPISYLAPMGKTEKEFENFGIPEISHSFFATRLVCAALLYSKHKKEGQMSLVEWILPRFMRKLSSQEDLDKNGKNCKVANIRTPFATSVVEFYSCEKREDAYSYLYGKRAINYLPSSETINKEPYINFYTEYNAGYFWFNQCGVAMAPQRSASDLLKASRGDAEFVSKVFQLLLRQPEYANTAKVALASKLAVYFRNKTESPCKRGDSSDDTKAKTAATAQIGKVNEIIKMVSRNQDPYFSSNVALAEMARSIYFSNDTDRNVLKPGCGWPKDPHPKWKEFNSDSHIEHPENEGGRLWLYGKEFRKFFDDKAIETLASEYSKNGKQYSGNGDQYARFIFLIPQCWSPFERTHPDRNKTLKDWPGKSAMRGLLHRLAQIEHENFDIKSELYDPIVRQTPISSLNTVFASCPDTRRN